MWGLHGQFAPTETEGKVKAMTCRATHLPTCRMPAQGVPRGRGQCSAKPPHQSKPRAALHPLAANSGFLFLSLPHSLRACPAPPPPHPAPTALGAPEAGLL